MSTLHISPQRQKLTPQELLEYLKLHRAELSRSDLEYVAMAGGKSGEMAGKYEYVPAEPELIVRVGGSLARIKTGVIGGLNGGARGVVAGFSAASRRRLMRLIASLERSERPVFVTLTYPDKFPESQEKWKRDIDVFGKRLARKMPDAGFLWRIEFKKRQSGVSRGRVAPHFHLLVYNANYSDLRGWVGETWWRVVGSGDGDHRKAGTRVENIWSFGGIMRYVGKYIAKEDDFPDGWRGRVWGVVGRDNLPWAVEVIMSLTEAQSIRLVRLARKMMRLTGKTLTYGVTWIVNAERVLDYLEYLIGFT